MIDVIASLPPQFLNYQATGGLRIPREQARSCGKIAPKEGAQHAEDVQEVLRDGVRRSPTPRRHPHPHHLAGGRWRRQPVLVDGRVRHDPDRLRDRDALVQARPPPVAGRRNHGRHRGGGLVPGHEASRHGPRLVVHDHGRVRGWHVDHPRRRPRPVAPARGLLTPTGTVAVRFGSPKARRVGDPRG